MKTLKISAVATVAATLCWLLGIPAKVWPEHPVVADLFLGVIITLVLQFAWTDSKHETS